MPRLPRPSEGILLSAHQHGGAAVYDLLEERVHFLNASAAALLAACAESTDREQAVSAWAAQTAAEEAVVARDVDAALAELAALGLIGRTTPLAGRAAAVAPVTPLHRAEAHTVQAAAEHRIRFRAVNPALVERVDTALGMGAPDATPTADFTMVESDSGGVTLLTDTQWPFPSEEALFSQLIGVVNDFVARSTGQLTLHAGGVRTPRGEVVLLPAAAGHGKSTLVGGLVQHGWAYLSDEAVGIREDGLSVLPYPKPLTLDATSCETLGLAPSSSPDLPLAQIHPGAVAVREETGPPARVVVPRYREGASPQITALPFHDAVVALLTNSLNLRYTGQTGFDTLCALAAAVPVHQISYGSTRDAIELIEALLAC